MFKKKVMSPTWVEIYSPCRGQKGVLNFEFNEFLIPRFVYRCVYCILYTYECYA